MAGELTKWTGGALVKRSSSALQRSREAREAAEAALQPQEPAISSYARRQIDRRMKEAMKLCEQMRSFDIFTEVHKRPVHEIYDLPRLCSVRKLPYVSRYILRGGRYEYAQDIRHKQGMNAVEYEAGYAVTFPLAEEVCAWCRAWGYAALFCRQCKTWCCYGQVAGGQGRCGNCGGEWRRIQMGEVEVIGFALRR